LEIKDDKNTRSNFRIVKKIGGRNKQVLVGGSRYSTSVGGTLTGFHGDILLVDDPLNPGQAASETEIKTANHWVEQTLSTRKTDKAITPTVIIMQRLHQDDPSGHMLAKQKANIKHISLPGECRNYKEQVHPPELIKFYKDDLLDPKRMPWSVLADMEADLGQYGYSGQVGQNPTPPGGGMFKVDHFSIIDNLPSIRNIVKSVRYWDKAATKEGKGAFTAGVKMHLLSNGFFVVSDVKRGRWETHERERIIRETAEADRTIVDVWSEQEPGSGGKESAQATVRNLAGFRAFSETSTGEKANRADPFSVQVNNGNVSLLRGIWNHAFIEEYRFFPYGTFKDQVDAGSGAFNKLAHKRIAGRVT
jgi:predicted phage terminase large subunit-like protein